MLWTDKVQVADMTFMLHLFLFFTKTSKADCVHSLQEEDTQHSLFVIILIIII